MTAKNLIATFLTTTLAASTASDAAVCSAGTRRAFDLYAATVEKRVLEQHRSPVSGAWMGNGRRPLPDAFEVEAIHAGAQRLSGGLLHHWRGTVLVPGARAADMLRLLRNVDQLRNVYAPDIQRSRVIRQEGDRIIVAMRLRKQDMVTAVFDAEFDVNIAALGPQGGYEISRSRHIRQVDRAGTSQENWRPENDDEGFLWGLNAYWSFREELGGLLIECETVSLTRDIPLGMGWLITPMIEDLPRTSLGFTLTATRNALLSIARQERDR